MVEDVLRVVVAVAVFIGTVDAELLFLLDFLLPFLMKANLKLLVPSLRDEFGVGMKETSMRLDSLQGVVLKSQ